MTRSDGRIEEGGGPMRTGPNVRFRADGRWEARYIKGRDENGKTIYGYVYAYSKEEAEKKRSELLRGMMTDSGETAERMMKSSLASMNPEITSENINKKRYRVRFADPLPEESVKPVEAALLAYGGGASLGYLSCLYMGISLEELAALRYSDFQDGGLTVSRSMPDKAGERGRIVACARRTIPLPDCMKTLLVRNPNAERTFYLLTESETPLEKPLLAVNLCRKITARAGLGKIHPEALRSTFIRRALESSLNLETVAALTGVEAGMLRRRFAGYIKADLGKIRVIYEDFTPRPAGRGMNLLILGAGSHGQGVRETAQKLGVFGKISFLDDAAEGSEILGKCGDYRKFLDEYPMAFVAIGDNAVRRRYMELLRAAGFLLPRLIHPDATVSPSATIGEGCVLLAQVTVNANARIQDGCILATGAIVDYGAEIQAYAHVDSAAMVTKDAVVESLATVESGEIVKKAVKSECEKARP